MYNKPQMYNKYNGETALYVVHTYEWSVNVSVWEPKVAKRETTFAVMKAVSWGLGMHLDTIYWQLTQEKLMKEKIFQWLQEYK